MICGVVCDIRHILPYEHSKTVTVPVPTSRLHFHVLPDEIESHFLGLKDIKHQGFIRRCSIKTVRPPALVKRTILEKRLTIENHTFMAFFVSGI